MKTLHFRCVLVFNTAYIRFSLRNLENRLDKAELKCNEAEQIKKTYLQIKSKLEDEALSFPNTLNSMEAEIKRLRHELKDLKVCLNYLFQ